MTKKRLYNGFAIEFEDGSVAVHMYKRGFTFFKIRDRALMWYFRRYTKGIFPYAPTYVQYYKVEEVA